MITLSKNGNAIRFTFVDNGHYLFNGTIDVPINSLSLITDESEMATFKKSATNDTFISALYSDFGMSKSELETWYMNNMVGSSGGSGSGGTTPEEVQQMIDESISGLAESSAVTLEISEAVSGKADSDSLATVATSGSYNDLLDKPTIPDVSNYFDGAEYDSGTTRINFYHGSTVKAYIDASAFIVDGMVDDVRIDEISGVTYLVIDFNTASGKEDIQIPLTDIFDPSNYYTKSEVDDAISAATDDMATQTWVGEQGYLTEHQSLSAYSTTEEVNSAIEEATSGKADTSAVTAVNDALTAHTSDSDIHVTVPEKMTWNAKSDFSGSYNDLTDKPTIPTVPTDVSAFNNDAGYITSDSLSGYAESSAVTEEISAAVSGKVDTTTYTAYTAATDTVLSGKLDASAYTPTDLSEYWTSAQTESAINAATSGKADSTDVTTVNNALTAHTSDSDIHVTVPEKVTWNEKQDALVSGTNIKTINNQSLLGSGNITIQGGGSGSSTVELTQAEYDALVSGGTVDPTTYYIITDATPIDMSNYYTSAQTESAISAATSGKVDTSSVVTAVTSASTDSEIPTAKAVYDAVGQGGGGGGTTYSAGTDIDITNDVISVKQISGDSAFVDVTSTLENETSVVINTSAIIATMKEDAVANGVTFYDNNGRFLDVENNGSGLDVLGNTSYFNYSTDGYTITASTLASGDTFISISNYSGIQLDSLVEYFAILTTTYSLQDFADNVYGKFSGYVATSAITSAVTSASTDNEIPTAKAVYDATQSGGGGGTTYSAGTNINIDSANTISCTLPIEESGGGIMLRNSSNSNAGANVKASRNTIIGYECQTLRDNSSCQTLFGSKLQTYNSNEFACGYFNVSTFRNTLFTVGNGTSSARHNAFEIRQNGDIYCNNGTSDVKLQDYIQFKIVQITQADYDALVSGGTVDASTLYIITNVVN